MKKLPPEREQEYREAWNIHDGPQLSKMFNISIRTVTATNKRLGLKKGLTDERGNPIKHYTRRKDAMPIGSIVTHNCQKTGKARRFIINEQGERVRLHIHNWLSAGNTIPEGYVLCYRDTDADNPDNIDNLILKTRIQNLLEHRGLLSGVSVFKINLKRQEKYDKALKRKQAKEVADREKEAKRAAREATRKERERVKSEILAERERKDRVRRQISQASAYNHRFRRREKVLEIKPVDTSVLIPVRIDHKTIVYAKSHADIPRIIERYSKKAS
jgi:hypothetical protein